MEETKLEVVRKYLNEKFSGAKIEERHDFDHAAQAFKIHKGKDRLLLKVSEIFMDDNSEDRIYEILSNQKIAEILEKNKELGVLVSSEPPRVFRRD